MASEYSVNIKLNTAQVKKDLKTIGTEISNLGRKEARSSKTALSTTDKRLKAETQVLNLQTKIQSTVNNLLKLDLKGVQAEKIRVDLITLRNNVNQKNLISSQKELAVLKQKIALESQPRQSRFGTTRGFDFQSALISGGFPLLFGQGPLGALAGGLGGGIGGMFGQMGGFAGGIAATAALQQLTTLTQEIGKLGNALARPTENIGTLVEKLGLTNDPAGRLALKLEKLGLTSSASALLMEEFTKQTGKSPDALSKATQEINQMNKDLATLTLNFQLLASKALIPIIDALNKVDFGSIGKKIKPVLNLLMFGQFEDPSETVNKMKGISNIPTAEGEAIIGGVKLNPDFGKTPEVITTMSSLEKLAKDMEFTKEILPLQQALEIETKRLTMSSDKLNIMKEQFELDNLSSELDILKLQNQEESTDALVLQISKLENQIALQEQVVANAKALIDPSRQVAQIFAQDMGNAIKGLIQGTQTLGGALNSVLNKMKDAALNMALFGNIGGNMEKGGGILGTIFGGFLANGGVTKPNKSYVVGERGPEIFTPGVTGRVTPNHAMGSPTNIVVNVDASGSSVQGDEVNSQQLGQTIALVVQETIVREKRSGGLLA